ncbi:MAG: hypothetical protein PHN55_12115 [Dysgonamonadaceae bacterium]|nr:hypothetical protein [Dysgonamonadaceae bacterium]
MIQKIKSMGESKITSKDIVIIGKFYKNSIQEELIADVKELPA